MACPIRSAEPLFLLTGAVLRACSGFELSVRISIKIQSKFDRSSIDAPFLAWGRLPIQFGAKFDQISITLRSKFVQNCSNLDGSALRSYSVLISHQSRSSFDQIWFAIGRISIKMWFLSTPRGALGCPGHSLGRPGVPREGTGTDFRSISDAPETQIASNCTEIDRNSIHIRWRFDRNAINIRAKFE